MNENIPNMSNTTLTTNLPTEPPSSISPAFGLKTHQPFTIVYTLLYSGTNSHQNITAEHFNIP